MVGFNKQDFEEYMLNPERQTEKPCGYSSINQYRAAVMKIHQDQVSSGTNNATKQMLLSNRTKLLLLNTQKKAKYITEDDFEEKLTANFAPYQTVGEIPQLAQALLDNNAFNKVYYSVSALRDRYCLL